MKQARRRARHSGSQQGQAGDPQPPEAERAVIRRGEKLRWLILIAGVLALLRLFVSDGLRGSLGLLPLPTWEWDVAAFTPLLTLFMLWDAHTRERFTLLSGELRWVSGLYLVYALPGALAGRWQLWPAVSFSIAVFVGIWYTNRQVGTRG
ncbi:hypothetical protein ACIQ6Y_37995 [Streptomyces sp. NPDC096205]|uniref:hypothetical protein n=1 Tax=Streptomyces sp. NPDC096205 TaxID=3366081 RepID=UPI003825FF74